MELLKKILLNVTNQIVQCVRTSSAKTLWINFINAYDFPKNAFKPKKIII